MKEQITRKLSDLRASGDLTRNEYDYLVACVDIATRDNKNPLAVSRDDEPVKPNEP